jgi:hypothetical protein
MSRLLVILVVILVGVLGLGFYLRWFGVESASADGKSNVTITVDTDRIRADEKRAVGAVHDLGHPATTKAAQPTEQNKDQSSPPRN